MSRIDDIERKISKFVWPNLLMRPQPREDLSSPNITWIPQSVRGHIHAGSRKTLVLKMPVDCRETSPRQLFTDDFEDARRVVYRTCEPTMPDHPSITVRPDRFQDYFPDGRFPSRQSIPPFSKSATLLFAHLTNSEFTRYRVERSLRVTA